MKETGGKGQEKKMRRREKNLKTVSSHSLNNYLLFGVDVQGKGPPLFLGGWATS